MSHGIKAGGLGGLGLIIVIVAVVFFDVDPTALLQTMETSQAPPASSMDQAPTRSAAEDELADFVSVVLADTEDTWNQLFTRHGQRYEEPVLVLYTGQVRSACGMGTAASGPFYCPGDHRLYIDLAFYEDLRTRFKAPGDFAQAYVIAHEVGHHVQNLLGISSEVSSRQRRVSKTEANELSVRLELQADCLAGVWAHHAQRTRAVLEAGDYEEAIGAASAVGDDRIQQQARGYVVPDSFTHGTSQQRTRWFATGFESGDVDACDTFAVSRP